MKKVVFLFLGVLVGVAVMVATMSEGCNADTCFGRILDSTGKPLKDVAVHGQYNDMQNTVFDVVTDVDGYFNSVEASDFFYGQVVSELTIDTTKTGYVGFDNGTGNELVMEGLVFNSASDMTLSATDIVLTKCAGFGNCTVEVKDSLTEDAVTECKVRFKKPVGYAIVNYTNGYGAAQMNNLLYGTYTVTVTKTGYAKKSIQKVNIPNYGSLTVSLVSN